MSVVHEQVREEERAAREQLRRLERARRVKAQNARSAKRNRTTRLREVEARMDSLAVDYRAADAPLQRAIRKELRDLGAERMRLRWDS
jgi:hypothetical protein